MMSTVTFEPVSFTDLPGWGADGHRAALDAFAVSAGAVSAKGAPAACAGLVHACCEALDLARRAPGVGEARAFFEERFRPHRVVHAQGRGLLTGYYEPHLEGSRTKTERFTVPIRRRPPDLVNLVQEAERGAKAQALTHARRTQDGIEPYATRAEIESGALDGQDLEFLFFEDPVDVFFLHVQGSGLVTLTDGSEVRVTYDGKNGHPYTSIGRKLIDAGLATASDLCLASLKAWLRADPERARPVMWQNASYIFFREAEGAKGPLGVFDIPLSTGRSLAVDTTYHAIGTPVYVTVPELNHTARGEGFHRLMIAQDVGSAIVGPERGDIYWGSGTEAEALAGATKHYGNFFVLLPGS